MVSAVWVIVLLRLRRENKRTSDVDCVKFLRISWNFSQTQLLCAQSLGEIGYVRFDFRWGHDKPCSKYFCSERMNKVTHTFSVGQSRELSH